MTWPPFLLISSTILRACTDSEADFLGKEPMRPTALILSILLAFLPASAKTREFRAWGSCAIGGAATREDAERIALFWAGQAVREEVSASLDSLAGPPLHPAIDRATVRALVAGLVDVVAARRRDGRGDSVSVEGTCRVDPDTLLGRMRGLLTDRRLLEDQLVGRAELLRLAGLMPGSAVGLPGPSAGESADRAPRPLRETLDRLEEMTLLIRARALVHADPTRARALVDSLIVLFPRSAEARLQRGALEHEAGHLEEAIRQYRIALNLRPDGTSIRYDLASALREIGSPDSAIAEYGRILRVAPRDPEVHFGLAGALREAGKMDSAILSYRHALQLEPEYLAARADLAAALHVRGDLDAAITEYRRVLQADSSNILVRLNLGTALKDLGRIDEAVAELGRVILQDPRRAEAHYNLGAALAAKGDRPGTLREMREAIRLSGDPRLQESAREVIKAFGGIP